jgi:rhamnose transport system ATP-binding protein
MDGSILLSVRGASKRFGGVQALRNVDLDLKGGEIHALLGENGAGKSTLLKTLAGVHRLDSGTVTLAGTSFEGGSTRRARDQGVAVIYQEPHLFPDLTLAENVFVGRQLISGKRVAWRRMASEAADLFAQLGVPLDPKRRARGLSIADQQIVEIAKALSINARVIVMDEPTAALSTTEVERLFTVSRRLRDNGAAVVFVSHRLDEVFKLCDRLTVMRDGATVATALVQDVDMSQIVKWMVGRELSDLFPKLPSEIGKVALEVKNLTCSGQVADVSFTVRTGEIVGLAGLVGSGRSEVVRAIFGIDRYESGSVEFFGEELPRGDPTAAMERGIALVPEDRRQQGLFMPSSVAKNIAITMLSHLRSRGLVKVAREDELALTWAKKMQVKFTDLNDPVEKLSGGNQQKVVLSKWLATKPLLLIVDEPTRGIDIGTKAEVHRLLSSEAANGLAVLMVSSELPEVLGMADRILVMREGRLVGEFSREEATPELVIAVAAGAVRA